jgi:hypothetical protein
MIYTGIDYHKRYSVACTLDALGRKPHEARIDGNGPAVFAAYVNGAQGQPPQGLFRRTRADGAHLEYHKHRG